MIDFVILEDLAGDFWEQNPEIALIEPFASFKKKKGSSEIMKAIYLIYDFKSKFNVAKEPREKVIEDVNTNFLKQPNFDWTKHTDVIEAYQEKCKTPLQRDLEAVYEDLRGLRSYITRLSWEDDEEAKIKKDYMKEIDSYYERCKNLEAKVLGEIQEKRFKGNVRKSFVEGKGKRS
jgi:hypothetical protein